ncbi:Lrp/AsnC family transcriptional regulator [Desulfonema ishimotonii]|uniref:Lrp/AsnC family transcriptional regulator n=1 Tax=Desulfonema ishimotonii TaxID=45657 RepID=A0A401FVQ1_9BACT|nr:Lrp/AsnC family transcriptional regulator [Desulfonema ishimotonii]GBC61014.1 Lrp/AsnC family transcriptional regulator [Desulfonema ishimotonii]
MIDEISLKILNILQEKARIPNVEVARQVGMAPSAVLERIRKLEKQGIIDGYEVRLNPERFARGFVAFIFVKAGETPGEIPVGEMLARIPEVQEVHFVAGEDAYLVKIRVADAGELGNIIREKIAQVDGVLSTRTATVLTTFKETARIPIGEARET